MVTEMDVPVGVGRTVHAYDSGAAGKDAALTVFWHQRTPQTGALPEPLLADAERLDIRFVSHDRPSYGGSTHNRAATLPQSRPDVPAVADALGIERFAVMSASGGDPHALACAALAPRPGDRRGLPGRVGPHGRRGTTGSPVSASVARPNAALRSAGEPHWPSTWRPVTSTRRCSGLPIARRWPGAGRGRTSLCSRPSRPVRTA